MSTEQERKIDEAVKRSEAQARKMKEDALREQENQNNPNEKKLKIEVETNSQAVRELAQENAELKAQVVSGKLEIAKDVTDALVQKYADFGLSAPRLDSKEDFDNAIEILKKLKEVKHESPSGSAPLPSSYYESIKPTKKGYSTYEEMVDDLRFREKSSDRMVSAEAHEILNALLGKSLKKVAKEDRKMPDYQEELPELKDYGNLKVRANSEDDPFHQKELFRKRQKAQKGE